MFIKLENYFCLKSHPHGQKITDMVFLEQNLFFFRDEMLLPWREFVY
jgi:hypothetical protein